MVFLVGGKNLLQSSGSNRTQIPGPILLPPPLMMAEIVMPTLSLEVVLVATTGAALRCLPLL